MLVEDDLGTFACGRRDDIQDPLARPVLTGLTDLVKAGREQDAHHPGVRTHRGVDEPTIASQAMVIRGFSS